MRTTPTPDQLRALAAYCRTGYVQTAATELGLAPQTIRNHLTRAYRTLGVGTALEAAARLGWLRVPEATENEWLAARYRGMV